MSFSQKNSGKKTNDFISQAQEIVLENLKDPDSAKFRKVVSYKNKGNNFVCGEVNSKNSMGGYVGFRSFYVDLKDRSFEVDNGFEADMDTPEGLSKKIFEMMYLSSCRNQD